VPVTYRGAANDMRGKEALELVDHVMKLYHGPKRDAGTSVDIIFAYPPTDQNGDPSGPALKSRGHRCAACIRSTNLKERAAGRADLEITIDSEWWDEHSAEERVALVDHELCHKELAEDSNGGVKRDDLDRPKFRTRYHDYEFGWFEEIGRRHGQNAGEVQQFEDFQCKVYQQLWLPYMEEEPERKAG